MSCKQDNTNKISSPAVHSATDNTPGGLTVESLKPKPATEISNADFIAGFVEYVEATYCKSKGENGRKCYGMHEASIKSDFLGKLPIALNFPYNGSFDWSGLVGEKGFNDYWSDKCGFMNENTGDVVTYYCLNISGSTRPWLDSLAATNTFIKEFTNFYYDTQSILPSYQSNFILNNVNNLDYDNIDHRAFYWMYHLSLFEEGSAATKTKNWK